VCYQLVFFIAVFVFVPAFSLCLWGVFVPFGRLFGGSYCVISRWSVFASSRVEGFSLFFTAWCLARGSSPRVLMFFFFCQPLCFILVVAGACVPVGLLMVSTSTRLLVLSPRLDPSVSGVFTSFYLLWQFCIVLFFFLLGPNFVPNLWPPTPFWTMFFNFICPIIICLFLPWTSFAFWAFLCCLFPLLLLLFLLDILSNSPLMRYLFFLLVEW